MAGRPRKEQPEVALAAAMNAFWAKGYEATSMADLVAATGLHKGSLYQTFGDKHALFLASLNRYLRQMYDTQQEIIQSEKDPILALHKMTSHVLDLCARGRGCLAVNTLIEVAPHDCDISEVLDWHRNRIAGLLGSQIDLAKESKQTSCQLPTADIVRLMMTFITGLTADMAAGLPAPEAIKFALVHMNLVLGIESNS